MDASKEFHKTDLKIISDCLGIDIGGTLFKISEFRDHSWRHELFRTENYDQAITYLEQVTTKDPSLLVNATGGGAHLLQKEICTRLTCNFKIVDEMEAIVSGFLALRNESLMYPFLLINIGSGVSVILVESAQVFRRISGSSLGGGTFRGIARLLSGVSEFEDLLNLAKTGSNVPIDLLVSDIYGSDYANCGLRGTLPASSFGKVGLNNFQCPETRKEDLVYSLMLMLCNNLAQISILNARHYGIKNIYFAGGFVDSNGTVLVFC